MAPPALVMVALPGVLMTCGTAAPKFHWPLPLLTVAPLASVSPLVKLIRPLVVKLGFNALPRVTPLSVPPLSTVPSVLTTLPPTIVPDNADSDNPPAPPPMSTVPVLVRVPVKLTTPEALRLIVPNWALVMALASVSVPPFAFSVPPVLLKLPGLMVKV